MSQELGQPLLNAGSHIGRGERDQFRGHEIHRAQDSVALVL